MKFLLLIIISIFLVACGGDSSDEKVNASQTPNTINSSDSSDSSDIAQVVPPQLSFELPDNIANQCEFNVQVINSASTNVSNIDWYIFNESSEILRQGTVNDGNIIELTIEDLGIYTLTVSAQYDEELEYQHSDQLIVYESVPKDIRDTDYIVKSGETQYLCEDVYIWNDATVKLENGSSLASVDENLKTILMRGDVEIVGNSENRISISNIKFENSFFSTETEVSIAASYADFINNATIENYQGNTDIYYSSFDSHFYQEDEGTLKYNVFKKGLSIEPDGTVIKNNDIYCDDIEICMSVHFYGFGGTFLNAIPTIENNNFYNPAENSITYINDSFTEYDINLRNNYWGGMTSTELDDVFFDANDTPDKTHIFLFEPMNTIVNDITGLMD